MRATQAALCESDMPQWELSDWKSKAAGWKIQPEHRRVYILCAYRLKMMQ